MVISLGLLNSWRVNRGFIPCRAWHVVQWQYFASRGSVFLIWNWTFPQWQPPSKRDSKELVSWILYGARSFHWFSSPSICSVWVTSWLLVFGAMSLESSLLCYCSNNGIQTTMFRRKRKYKAQMVSLFIRGVTTSVRHALPILLTWYVSVN